MELLKLDERPAEFTWQGITVLYRTRATVGDKFEIDTAGIIAEGDQITFKKWDMCKALIRVFVVGWRGVTENGVETPYSYDALLNRLPADMQTDLVMQLGARIAQDTGFAKAASTEDGQKNG